MQTRRTFAAVGFSIAFVPLAAAQTPPRDTRSAGATGTAVIRGRVVAADTGRPLSLATLTASGPGLSEPRSISTNSEGRYELRRLPAGLYTVTVAHSGYLRLQYGQRRPLELGRPIQVAEGQIIDNIDFILPRMSVISGRITDEEGEPFAGALVMALQSTDGRLAGGDSGAAQTDDSGAYRITGLSPGSYVLMSDNWGGPWTDIENGGPRVHGFASTYFPGVSDPSSAQRVAVGLGEEARNANFSLIPARLATLTGTLIDSRGRPVPNAMIAVLRQSAGANIAGGPTRRTNEDGTFTIPNLAPGEIMLLAGGSFGPPGAVPPEAVMETVVVNGVDMTLTLTTSSGWSVRGRIVTEDGQLPATVRSRVGIAALAAQNALMGIRMAGIGGPAPGRVNDDGSFEVSGIFGAARLSVNVPDGWTQKEIVYGGRNVAGKPIQGRNGDVVSDIQVVLTEKTTKVSGQLTDTGGAPPVNGTVLVFADDPERWYFGTRFVRAVRPNQNGQFDVTGLPPAEYLAVAVDYVTERMWNDPVYLESLRSLATKFNLAAGESKAISLRLAAP